MCKMSNFREDCSLLLSQQSSGSIVSRAVSQNNQYFFPSGEIMKREEITKVNYINLYIKPCYDDVF